MLAEERARLRAPRRVSFGGVEEIPRASPRRAPEEDEIATECEACLTVDVVGRGDQRDWGDEMVTRGTVLGNPFVMIGRKRRAEVVAAYGELLKGERGAHEIARDYLPSLMLSEQSARVTHAARLGALERLLRRARGGERLRLRCVCAPLVCHADVIAEWIESRVVQGTE